MPAKIALTMLLIVALLISGCNAALHFTAVADRNLPPSSDHGGAVSAGPFSGAVLASPLSVLALAAAGATESTANGRVDRLSVLTFNMEHRDRPNELAVVADHLRSDLDEVPDFLLFQEVVFGRFNAGEPNTAAVLADDLGYHWNGTKRTSDREGVAIASRYPFVYYDSRNLKSQTSRLLLGFRRVSVMGEFLVPDIGRVRVVNVHFTYWGFEHRVRRNQLSETLQWITEREQQVHADVTILGGDFNFEPGGDEVALVQDRGATGDLAYRNYNSNEPTRGSRGHPSKRVDYIFIAGAPEMQFLGENRLWANGLQRDDRASSRFWPSDHVPVLQEFAIAPAPQPLMAVGASADTP